MKASEFINKLQYFSQSTGIDPEINLGALRKSGITEYTDFDFKVEIGLDMQPEIKIILQNTTS